MTERSLEDDLRELLGGLAAAAAGVDRAAGAVDRVADRADAVIEHVASPAAVGRILGTVAEGVLREVSEAPPRCKRAANAPPTGAPAQYTHCSTHGKQLWRHTLICRGCETFYQLLHAYAPGFPRSEYCAGCGIRFLPGKSGDPYSAARVCSICAEEQLRNR
jgi:hypothetical protein